MQKRKWMAAALALLLGLTLAAPAYAMEVPDYAYADADYIYRGKYTLQIGDTKDLLEDVQWKLTVEDNDGFSWSLGSVSWTSSTPDKVTVDKNGVVTAVGLGSSRIKATGWDNKGGLHEQVFLVSVRKSTASTASAQTSIMIEKGSLLDLSQLARGDVEWSVSPERIASVDENGMVTGLSVGKCTVKATSLDGEQVQKFTVRVRTDSLAVNALETTVALKKGDSVDLFALLYPVYVDRGSIRSALRCDSRSDKVSISGLEVTAKETGSCTVTIREKDDYYGIAERSVKVRVY